MDVRAVFRTGATILFLMAAQHALAVNVVIDYTYDTNNFFGAGNPDGVVAGSQAKASLEAAADFFSDMMEDSFSVIETPETYVSRATGGADVYYNWSWGQTFDHPATNADVTISNSTIPADDYIIYAGARSIAGSTLGIGGPGGFNYNSGGSYYFQWQLNDIEEITDEFLLDIEQRGDADGGFSSWGGAITFDNDSSTNWHYDHTSSPSFSENDFFSVALHELAHSLGFGASDEWSALVSGSTFFGSESRAANNNIYPSVTGGHWAYNTQSTVYGDSASQEAAMDPNITNGERKLFTTLDAAGLADIGWEVAEPTISRPGDYDGDGDVDSGDYATWRSQYGQQGDYSADGNSDGQVDAADYTVWRDNLTSATVSAGQSAPEPTSLVLLAAVGCLVGSIRR